MPGRRGAARLPAGISALQRNNGENGIVKNNIQSENHVGISKLNALKQGLQTVPLSAGGRGGQVGNLVNQKYGCSSEPGRGRGDFEVESAWLVNTRWERKGGNHSEKRSQEGGGERRMNKNQRCVTTADKSNVYRKV